jgi:hypothetical protein
MQQRDEALRLRWEAKLAQFQVCGEITWFGFARLNKLLGFTIHKLARVTWNGPSVFS